MIGYFFYFLLAVGLSVLLTASFRRLRGDGPGAIPPQEDVDFDRRMAAIEKRFGKPDDEQEKPDGENADRTG